LNSPSNKEKLDFLFSQIKSCQRCPLSASRSTLVFGDGNPDSRIVFAGEAPGKEEDLQGRPFVGRSGQLLSEMILDVFRLQRKDYYITNILKCRPTINQEMIKDRPPAPEEIASCMPILMEQLKIVKPDVIVAIGSSSTKALLNTNEGITTLRGKWSVFKDIPLLPTFHPSYVLRNGGKNSPQYAMMIADLKKARERLL